MDVALLTQHVTNTCQRRQGDMVLTTEELPETRSTSVKKVSGQMRSDAFERRLASALQ